MRTSEVIRFLRLLVSRLETEDYLSAALEEADGVATLESLKESFEIVLATTATTQQNVNAVGVAQRLVAEISSTMRKWESRQIYRSLDDRAGLLEPLSEIFPGAEVGSVSELVEAIERASAAYQTFVQTYDTADAYRLLERWNTLERTRRTLLNLARSILTSLEVDFVPAGYGHLQLTFSGEVDAALAAVKIETVAGVYADLCRLLDVPESEYPLRIVRAETGSLWVDLLGHEGVLTLLAGLLISAARYASRGLTTEGKIRQMAREAESFSKLVEVATQMKEAEMDTSAAEARLEAYFVQFVERSGELWGGKAPLSEVNGRPVSGEGEQRLPPTSVPLLLGEGEADPANEPPDA